MKKQLVIIGIVTILVTVGLSGCEDNNTSYITPSIMTFSISPYSIEEGNTTELSWDVMNATLITIDNRIGNVSLKGARIITPTNTTTYTLTARNGDKETHATCQIIVTKIDYNLKLVGTWHNRTTVNIDLFSDGTCKFQSINGTWNLKNDKLVLIFTDYSITYNYVFSNNNQTLTLTDIYEGTTFNVTKQ